MSGGGARIRRLESFVPPGDTQNERARTLAYPLPQSARDYQTVEPSYS
jgi:hypothetical protein